MLWRSNRNFEYFIQTLWGINYRQISYRRSAFIAVITHVIIENE